MKKVNHFTFFDWKNFFRIFSLFTFIILFFFTVFNLSYMGMLWQSLQKTAKIKGEVFERKEISNSIQTQTNGNISHLELIQFKYSFTVNGITHIDSCFLKYSLINSNSLLKLQKQKLPVEVLVRYNPRHTDESILWIP